MRKLIYNIYIYDRENYIHSVLKAQNISLHKRKRSLSSRVVRLSLEKIESISIFVLKNLLVSNNLQKPSQPSAQRNAEHRESSDNFEDFRYNFVIILKHYITYQKHKLIGLMDLPSPSLALHKIYQIFACLELHFY